MIRRLLFVNLASILFLSKFLILIIHDVSNNAGLESLALYSLVVGLTSSIFNVANLRGRVYVLSEINNAAGIIKYNAALLFANVVGILIVLFAFNAFAYFDLIICVAAIKITENFFDGNISFLQKRLGRNYAFVLMNIRAIAVICVYAMFIVLGELIYILVLELAVGLLSSVYVFAIVGRLCQRDSRKNKLNSGGRISFSGILRGVSLLSICAGLNAALSTVSLAYLMNHGMDADAKSLALVFAALAVVTRLLVNNVFFFRQEIARARTALARWAKIVVGIGLIVFTAAYVQASEEFIDVANIPDAVTIAILLAALQVVHSLNVLLRQGLLLTGRAYFLTKFHAVELLILSCVLILMNPDLAQIVLTYFLLRSARVFAMARQL